MNELLILEHDSPAANSTVETTLSAGELLESIPDPSLRQKIELHEQAYKERLKTSKEKERESMHLQDLAVAKAIQAGKDKRQIRKLKNRLSAVRSRQRKEAENALNAERLLSLEKQVRGLSSLIQHLQSNNKKNCPCNSKHHNSRKASVGSDLHRLARGRLGLREKANAAVPVPRVRGAGTTAGGQPISEMDLQALMEDFDSRDNLQEQSSAPTVVRQHSFDLSYLSKFPPLSDNSSSSDVEIRSSRVGAATKTMPLFQPSFQTCCNKFTKSRNQRKENSNSSVPTAYKAVMATTPGHALKSNGTSNVRPVRGIMDKKRFVFMDQINGGTRMLPRRRVVSSVKNAACTKKRLQMMRLLKSNASTLEKKSIKRREQVCREKRRTKDFQQRLFRRRARTRRAWRSRRSGEGTRLRHFSTERKDYKSLKWHNALLKLSFMLAPLIWQRRRSMLRR